MAALERVELAPDEAELLLPAVRALVEAASRAEEREQPRLPVRHHMRDAGYVPSAEEDPLNAFVRIIRVEGADDGPLAGLTVAVKDNISIAGIPTTNGSRLPPYTPTVDAVVVERILDAGGTLVGKLNMDEFGGGGLGVMSAFGPSRNPIDPSRSAGGSSSGAGAAVGGGLVDLALGVDQGGSGRIPAAFCGLVCAKATHGLVPSFGVVPIDHTIDFVTPITRTVHHAALLLEVIAGDDWRDPQWVRGPITTAPYTEAAGAGVDGLRIGIVQESVTDDCEPAVVAGLERAAATLREAGAVVEWMSLPVWADGFATYQPYVAHLIANSIRTEGEGVGHLGFIDVDRMHAFAVARRAQSRELNPFVKCWLFADRYLRERYMGVTYGTLQNLRLLLRRRVTEALADWDLLLTPTVPLVAPKLFEQPPSTEELLAFTPASLAYNTSPLNLTGHPALSVPSGSDADGLPVAVQIVGRHFDEFTAFRAAFTLEERLEGG
jgi:amidase